MTDQLLVRRTPSGIGTTRDRLEAHLISHHWYELWQLAGKSDSELTSIHDAAHRRTSLKINHDHEGLVSIVGDEGDFSGLEEQGEEVQRLCRQIANNRNLLPAVVWQQCLKASSLLGVNPAKLARWWSSQ